MTREGDQKTRFQMERKILCQEIGRAIQHPFSSERLRLHWNQSVQHGVGEPCVFVPQLPWARNVACFCGLVLTCEMDGQDTCKIILGSVSLSGVPRPVPSNTEPRPFHVKENVPINFKRAVTILCLKLFAYTK